MNIVESTRRYDRWLEQRLPVIVKRDLEVKHQRMAQDPFSFLRATFYRWAQVWPQQCPQLTKAPAVLGVGDLHLENFGTWRDGEGRLIWGINDFDEAASLPYTNDLVRLCASALIAIGQSQLLTSARRACDAVLAGYQESLEERGKPVVLAEHNRWLRDLAVGRLKEQRTYWGKLLALKPTKPRPSQEVRDLLQKALPERNLEHRIVHRRAGLGSLGRQRFAALAHWRGGMIAREVKPLTTSAWWWLSGKARPIQYQQICRRAVRVVDPYLDMRDGWVIRRLAPDCSRIEIEHLTTVQDECKLLRMMGWEIANVHLGSAARRSAILEDLRSRKKDWLSVAARRMSDATVEDFRAWRTSHEG